MLVLISHGDFSDYTIDGIVDIPIEGFDVQLKFLEFLESKGIDPDRWYAGDSRKRLDGIYKELTGRTKSISYCHELIMPWLESIGIKEIKYEEFNVE